MANLIYGWNLILMTCSNDENFAPKSETSVDDWISQHSSSTKDRVAFVHSVFRLKVWNALERILWKICTKDETKWNEEKRTDKEENSTRGVIIYIGWVLFRSILSPLMVSTIKNILQIVTEL